MAIDIYSIISDTINIEDLKSFEGGFVSQFDLMEGDNFYFNYSYTHCCIQYHFASRSFQRLGKYTIFAVFAVLLTKIFVIELSVTVFLTIAYIINLSVLFVIEYSNQKKTFRAIVGEWENADSMKKSYSSISEIQITQAISTISLPIISILSLPFRLQVGASLLVLFVMLLSILQPMRIWRKTMESIEKEGLYVFHVGSDFNPQNSVTLYLKNGEAIPVDLTKRFIRIRADRSLLIGILNPNRYETYMYTTYQTADIDCLAVEKIYFRYSNDWRQSHDPPNFVPPVKPPLKEELPTENEKLSKPPETVLSKQNKVQPKLIKRRKH